MPKKAKLGKSRRDKAYWAAKEIGYRYTNTLKCLDLDPGGPCNKNELLSYFF